nr:hypothetical protein [uncultured Pseudogulbenkiania sp.]
MQNDWLMQCLLNDDRMALDEHLRQHSAAAGQLREALTTVDLSPLTQPAHWLTPVYVPVVVLSRHSLSPQPLPVDALTEHLVAMTGQANTFVVPTLLDLSRVLAYHPSAHYGLAAQIAFNQLLGEDGPYPGELDYYVGGEGRLRQAAGLLMAGVLGPDRAAAGLTLHPTAETLQALARLLSLHFCEEGQPSPRVYVGLPSLYGDFRCHALNLLAYTGVEQLAARYPEETIEIRPIATPSEADSLTCQVSIKGQPFTRLTVLREGWRDFTRALGQGLRGRYAHIELLPLG